MRPGPPPLLPPYVLLDDARPGGAGARLYRDPVEEVEACAPGDVAGALARVRAGLARGLWAAGWLAYGAGHALDPAVPGEGGRPVLWFGLFRGYEAVEDVSALLPEPAGAWLGPMAPGIGADDYAARFGRVAELIRAGDLYQANLSFRAHGPFRGVPAALHAQLRGRAGAGWGAVIDRGMRGALVSASPELFFALSADGRLACRPMKGTAPRGADTAADDAAAAALARDAKQRAENLMIVDLIRNDLSRVAVPGSVRVPELFAVERYPTVLQMVSRVEARAAPGLDGVDVLAALFPCGSVTGAPKVRATQVIAAVEADARGAYTGAIGHLDPDGAAQFSVAIRTLAVAEDRATLGLGSAVVADSDAAAEWAECSAKAAFLPDAPPPMDLIETMAFDPDEGLLRLDRHLARMAASAEALGFRFDRHGARNELQAATFRLRGAARVRLLLSRGGALAVETGPMPRAPDGPVAVAVVPLPVDARDVRLAHKTSRRGFYDAARGAVGQAWEVVFRDADGFLTEGSFTSLFVERGGRLLTPPLARGLLPGVLRAELLDSARAEEADLREQDLGGGHFFLGNAVRGLLPARLLPL